MKCSNTFRCFIYYNYAKLYIFSPLLHLCQNMEPGYKGDPPADSIFGELGSKITQVFQSEMKEPWFYYVHVMDLHWPLIVPEKYNDTKYGATKYDRVVSSVDSWIGKISQHIDQKNTLVIITADHGAIVPVDDKDVTEFEPNFDTGLKLGKRIMPKSTHKLGAKLFTSTRNMIRDLRLKTANKNLSEYEKRSRLPYFTLSLFDEAIRVPLLFTGLDIKPKMITQQVRGIDIFPTIAEIIKLPYEKQIQGRSLFPFFNDNKIEELPVYMHTIPYQEISPNDAVGIRTSQYKYFRGSREPNYNVHLYDLKNDPLENNNIALSNPEIVKQMEMILTKIQNVPVKHNDITEDEEKKIREELKKLGYL